MNADTVIKVMQDIAPLELAAEWDNVGLLIGSATWPVESIMLTIDLTEAVAAEAVERGVNMVIAYHPPIFKPLHTLTDHDVRQRIVLEMAQHRIAVYSPHTALDAAPGGVNDWLCDALGTGQISALTPHAALSASEQCKLVTFCPEQVVDAVRTALAGTGAGRIGDYEQCSFELRGSGTFFGGDTTSPTVGTRGRLERVDEVRLEMVCSIVALPAAIEALREVHPYEEPPIEVYALQPQPARGIGEGRRIILDRPATLDDLIPRIKKHLGVSHLEVPTGGGKGKRYQRCALCAGAGGSLVDGAIRSGCELFLTGEMRHHDVLEARARGCAVVLAGHTNTERGYLRVLRKRLLRDLSEATITISRRDAAPLRVI